MVFAGAEVFVGAAITDSEKLPAATLASVIIAALETCIKISLISPGISCSEEKQWG
ncbi:MAG: hypothetical protein HC903_27690 [Methylacidiphilales bacterium]|nr:hypothetical protein [Candidatus Methylacidiphilales bacterium]